MKRISSRQNPLVRRLREALHDHDREIVLEGPKQIADALESGWRAIALITNHDELPLPPSLVPSQTELVRLDRSAFEAVAGTRTSQGLLALFEKPRGSAAEILDRRDTVAVALDGVQDPGNVGTIIRLAAAFDAAGVLLLHGCADPFGPKAIRASSGAILRVPVAPVSEDALIEAGVTIVAASIGGARIDPPARDAVLLFGNEGAGVSESMLRHAQTIAIPMSGKVESLNVASSAAILLSRSYARRSV